MRQLSVVALTAMLVLMFGTLLPKEEYVVFVCATGARAGEMYFGIKDECKADTKRLFFLDAEVAYTPKGPVIK